MVSLIIVGGSISSNRQRSSSMAAMLTGCRSTRAISVSVSSTVSGSRSFLRTGNSRHARPIPEPNPFEDVDLHQPPLFSYFTTKSLLMAP